MKTYTDGQEKGRLNAEVLRVIRKSRRESQTKFWRRFGVTQSRGSRFELGTEMPSPITILIKLYLDGVIGDSDLLRARRKKLLES